MALEKGTEEWMMFGDFFNYCKKYWEMKDTDEYWELAIEDGNKLCDKYKDIPMVKKIVMAFLEMQELNAK